MASVEQFKSMLQGIDDDTLIMIQSVLILEILSRTKIIDQDIASSQIIIDSLKAKRDKFLPLSL
jgi:hypothetical protein